VAIVMSCLGLYGVIAYAVARRTSEIGIRMSLGATREQILRMVLLDSATLALAGIVIGGPLAFATTRALSSWWFGISASDPVTFATSALVTLAVTAAASAVPAHRASRVDPVTAIRTE